MYDRHKSSTKQRRALRAHGTSLAARRRMRLHSRQLLGVCAILLFGAVSAFAQDASLVGTITDETKAVLPGVTVTATNLETGTVVGGIVVPSVELLVGQNAAVPFMLRVATVGEELTVTGEAPLVDVSSSQVTGNVDRRQMEQLPLQGRNWMELSMMVKGITANSVGNQPGVSNDDFFQLNLDGQQITQKLAGSGFGQPAFSRDAISEFQIITSQFDITQGRSAGIQVQAISKSGTNTNAGSFYGFFRDDKLNTADKVAKTVLPYSDQQIGGTLGGPGVLDKLHYFVGNVNDCPLSPEGCEKIVPG